MSGTLVFHRAGDADTLALTPHAPGGFVHLFVDEFPDLAAS